MPILKSSELAGYIGKDLATGITMQPKAFEVAERAATEEIVALAGYTVPANADDAPDWAKDACAFIILNARIGVIPNISLERHQWAARQYARVIAALPARKTTTSDGSSLSQTAAIEGMAAW